MQVNKAIQNRWSPRAFSNENVTPEMIELLFEAARWAPSAMNEQPWRYYYVHRENKKVFNEIIGLLSGINPGWAKNSQVLIISVVKKHYDYKNHENRNALHDLGAANVSLAIQAAEIGLQVHQMAGFDKNKAAEYLQLDIDNFAPITIFAVGFPGNANDLPDDLKQRELTPRTRKEQTEFVKELK